MIALAFRLNNACDDAVRAAVVLAATSSRDRRHPDRSHPRYETGCVHLLVSVGGEDAQAV